MCCAALVSYRKGEAVFSFVPSAFKGCYISPELS